MPEQTPQELFARFQRNALAGGVGLDEEMLDEDVVVEMPFAPDGHERRIEGRQAIAARLREGRQALPIMFEEFRDVVIHETADPEVIVAEYVMVATMPGTGKRASAPFVVVLRARDGRIVHWREYQDRAAITEALGLLSQLGACLRSSNWFALGRSRRPGDAVRQDVDVAGLLPAAAGRVGDPAGGPERCGEGDAAAADRGGPARRRRPCPGPPAVARTLPGRGTYVPAKVRTGRDVRRCRQGRSGAEA